MNESYDIIVLGSGLGGLAAAFEASRAGKKVLLLEQHNLPGGFATSFVRGRFEFEPSLHEMPNIPSIEEASGVVRYLLDDAGLNIDFETIPDAYRVILTRGGVDVRMPFGVGAFINTIEKQVPGSREPVTAYMELCRDIQEAFGYLSRNEKKVDYRELMRRHGNFIRTGAATADEVADRLKVPPAARDLLYPYWCYLGVPTNRLSFTIWAALLNSYISGGAVIPRHRSHEISSAFVEKILEHGGRLRFNTQVARINTRSGRVVGVTTAAGEEIHCGALISNASPTLVFNSLIHPSTEVPPAARKNINARKHGFSLVVVYLGLDAGPEELGLQDYSYFIAPHMDTRALYENIGNLECRDIMQASVCLNVANPACSPPGTTILALTAGFRSEAWAAVRPSNYVKTKEQVARKLIDQFEKAVGTSILPHIEEVEVAAPATFARYTGAYDGIVYGYEPEPWDSIVPRAMAEEKEHYFENLRFCGGFSYRCHGYGSSILSGKSAAEKTLARTGG
ncbi:MAG: NAD(P)/FAD-dependent oxidoreductase [Spirochaetales bacterium]|nr:NAD(P)/FAD-dependent oxidoreductase [Spirochaetales bacterium]